MKQNKEVKATLTHEHHDIFTLSCDNIELRVTGRAPSTGLCRKLVAIDPSVSGRRLVVSLPCGKVCYTVEHIGRHAERQFRENSSGIHVAKYVEFPEQFNGIRGGK